MFSGSIVALITPFTQSGQIDIGALQNLVEWHIEQGTDAICCCGTTGEAPTLSEEEKLVVMKACVDAAKKRIPVIAGTGTNCTRRSLEMTLKAKTIGVDAALVIVPYYNRPTQLGVVAHFREVAKAKLPMIIYHHPKRTGIAVEPRTFSMISQIPEVIGIKEASSNISVYDQIASSTSLPMYSGDDMLTVQMMQHGAKGVISVIANVIPKQWKEIIDLCKQKNWDEALKKEKRLVSLLNTLSLEPNPQCIKYAVSHIGKCSERIRLPLLEPSGYVKNLIENALLEVTSTLAPQ
ncbi:MAG TPA: 4-hydroxy-tetrahydrodipicolinate synthase [Chlamydiales bacterium]|nr:4-hydroxy-tetrahydrodipicolinate synthase [Chlamydiales bacterium]